MPQKLQSIPYICHYRLKLINSSSGISKVEIDKAKSFCKKYNLLCFVFLTILFCLKFKDEFMTLFLLSTSFAS